MPAVEPELVLEVVEIVVVVVPACERHPRSASTGYMNSALLVQKQEESGLQYGVDHLYSDEANPVVVANAFELAPAGVQMLLVACSCRPHTGMAYPHAGVKTRPERLVASRRTYWKGSSTDLAAERCHRLVVGSMVARAGRHNSLVQEAVHPGKSASTGPTGGFVDA